MVVLAVGKVAVVKQNKKTGEEEEDEQIEEGEAGIHFYLRRNPSKRSSLVGVNLWKLDEK
jgi:hypothetical protein